MAAELIPVEAPDLQPLRSSFEQSQLESEFKAMVIAVFNAMIRDRERAANLLGMPHLGDDALMMRNIKADGLAVVHSDSTKLRFLLKAWRARNPQRGTKFLRTYLQALWPNQCTVEQLWMPLATANEYPVGLVPDGDPATHFLTSRSRVNVSTDTDDGTGLAEVARAFRSTMPARKLLELRLHGLAESSFGLANAAAVTMPLYGRGTLQNSNTAPHGGVSTANGAAVTMPIYLTGTLA